VASPFGAVPIVGLDSGLGDSLRTFETEFFLVPSQMRALPDCQSISALTDTETYFSDKRLLLIACMIRLPAAIENIHLSPGAATMARRSEMSILLGIRPRPAF
jgi:hypothetical protein